MSTISNRNKSFYEVKSSRKKRYELIIEYMGKYNKPISARELALGMYQDGVLKTPERNQVHPRLTELISLGKVLVYGSILDEVTNRKVAVYKLSAAI